MKVSIITCTYNRLEKLKINIQSVIDQNYKNYEHIIISEKKLSNNNKNVNL